MKEFTNLDAFYMFKEAYENRDDRLQDDDFDALMEGINGFNLTLFLDMKEQIGEKLLEKYESELEEYRDSYNKAVYESEEEDKAVERFYEGRK